MSQIAESRDKYSGGLCPSPAQGRGSRCREIHPSEESDLFRGLGILAFVSQSIMGTQMAKDMDGWSGKSRIWGRKGQYCELGCPIRPPEEEFGQLYGHPVAAGRAPNMDRKVGSDEWSESVPPTCDWRKKSGVISSVKDQVSASIQPQWWEGEERARLGPLTQPFTPPHQKNCKCCWAMAAAGNIEALWGIKHHQPVEVSVQGKAERGHVCRWEDGDWSLATHTVPFCTRASRLYPLWEWL